MQKTRKLQFGLFVLALAFATQLAAQSQSVPVPPDTNGNRVRVRVTGSGTLPNGEFSTGNRSFGGRPFPSTWGPIYGGEACGTGPYPSGFLVNLIETRQDILDFHISFATRKDCAAPLRVGTTYEAKETPDDVSGPIILVRNTANLQGCGGSGTGTVTINALEAYSGKTAGSLIRFGYLNASFTVTCPGGRTVTGTLEMSDDAITSNDELLNPDDADGGGDGGDGGGGGDGGSSEPPPPPPPDATVSFPDTVLLSGIQLTNGSSATVPVHVNTHNSFVGDVNIDVFSNAPANTGFDVKLSKNFFGSPGVGSTEVTVSVGPNTLPNDYSVTVMTSANGKVAFNTFTVRVLCDPPMILGVDQPRGATISGNASATLEAKPVGSGPFTYQWYNGPRGSTNSPVSGGTTARLTTSNEGLYWVRVTNACGSVDSAAAPITRP